MLKKLHEAATNAVDNDKDTFTLTIHSTPTNSKHEYQQNPIFDQLAEAFMSSMPKRQSFQFEMPKSLETKIALTGRFQLKVIETIIEVLTEEQTGLYNSIKKAAQSK